MGEWLRQHAEIALGFAAGVVVTLAVSFVIGRAPDPAPSTSDDGPLPTRLGGTLDVSGDRSGAFALNRQAAEAGVAIEGDRGRVVFDSDPVGIAQLSYNGWEFFPDPGECSVSTGSVNPAIGVVAATIRCDELADARGNGQISLAGTIGVPATLLGIRGDLPPSGGELVVGDRTLSFSEAVLRTWVTAGQSPYNMRLADAESGIAISFVYDPHDHAIAVSDLERDGANGSVPSGACVTRANELGRLAPNESVVELEVGCGGVTLPGVGATSVTGTLVVDVVDIP